MWGGERGSIMDSATPVGSRGRRVSSRCLAARTARTTSTLQSFVRAGQMGREPILFFLAQLDFLPNVAERHTCFTPISRDIVGFVSFHSQTILALGLFFSEVSRPLLSRPCFWIFARQQTECLPEKSWAVMFRAFPVVPLVSSDLSHRASSKVERRGAGLGHQNG